MNASDLTSKTIMGSFQLQAGETFSDSSESPYSAAVSIGELPRRQQRPIPRAAPNGNLDISMLIARTEESLAALVEELISELPPCSPRRRFLVIEETMSGGEIVHVLIDFN